MKGRISRDYLFLWFFSCFELNDNVILIVITVIVYGFIWFVFFFIRGVFEGV